MAEKKSGCCPVGSEPQLAPTHTPLGTNTKIGDLPIYINGHGEKAIIVVPDIYGPEGGRTKLIADQLAAAGYFVILPDFFRGDAWKFDHFDGVVDWVVKYLWNKLSDDFSKHLYPYLESKGVKSTGMIGFCWGAYIVFSASASGKFNCGVSCHPTLTKFPESAEQLGENVKCPQLLMPGGNDPPEIREGGSLEKILKGKPFGDKVKIKTFPEMKHGWVNRGDLNDPDTARDAAEALKLAFEYFKENL